jgi:hypothetical protein
VSAALAARRRALVGRSARLRLELADHAVGVEARLAPVALGFALLGSRAGKTTLAALAALVLGGRGRRFGTTFRRVRALLGLVGTIADLVGRAAPR